MFDFRSPLNFLNAFLISSNLRFIIGLNVTISFRRFEELLDVGLKFGFVLVLLVVSFFMVEVELVPVLVPGVGVFPVLL